MNDILYVVNNSDNVKINKEKLKDFANKIDFEKGIHWSKENQMFQKLSTEEKILYVFILESINFCFWSSYNWLVDYKGETYHGSDSLFYSMTKAVENKSIILDVNELLNLSEEQFKNIFMSNNILPDMIEERYKSFRNTVESINNIGLDKLINDLYSIMTEKELEEYICKNFKSYDDKCEYKGRMIHFNKRCRLLIGDLYYNNKTIRENTKALETMLGCADYRIPQYLHDIGILIYSKELENTIINKELIPYGDNKEIEIRAATLYVLEKLKDIVKETKPNITTAEIDNAVWRMSRTNKTDFIHHTKSIYY
ncbi:MAG: hypothetical protein IJ097_00500 [Bacilli bacterium]|nr:hypothetical protein [Bacilli bacterium]